MREETDEYIEKLETLLYESIMELEYVQSVENCRSPLCASAKGRELIKLGMATLGVNDLSTETWKEVIAQRWTQGRE